MEERSYEILKFLSQQTQNIPYNKFPEYIQDLFQNRGTPLSKGGIFEELERIRMFKGWIDLGYKINEKGKNALQIEDARKIHNEYVEDLKLQQIIKTVDNLQNQLDNFKPSNRRANIAIIISFISMIIVLLKGCKLI